MRLLVALLSTGLLSGGLFAFIYGGVAYADRFRDVTSDAERTFNEHSTALAVRAVALGASSLMAFVLLWRLQR
jgi:hypothetical protein